MRTDSDPNQKQHELAVFRCFIDAYPSFGDRMEAYGPAPKEPADVLAKLKNGGEIGFQLGEWLEPLQAATAKRKEKLRSALQRVFSASSIPEPSNFAYVMIQVKEVRFRDKDMDVFKNEFGRLTAKIDRNCSELFEHGNCYLPLTEFAEYPTLQKYVRSALFLPRDSYQERAIGEAIERAWSDPDSQGLLRQFHEDVKVWAEAQGVNILREAQAPSWTKFPADGGAYSSENAVRALKNIFDKKICHYGKSESSDIRLLIYYDDAVLYNSPYHDLAYETFESMAREAARFLATKTPIPFTKVYLVNALSPGPEVFEVWPTLAKCG